MLLLNKLNLKMTRTEFNLKYPFRTALTDAECRQLNAPNDVITWDSDSNKSIMLRIIENYRISGYFTAVYNNSIWVFYYHVRQYWLPIKIDRYISNCSCGANFTSNPLFHLHYCPGGKK